MANDDDRRRPRSEGRAARGARPARARRGALVRLRERIGRDRRAYAQSLVALVINSSTSLVAGLVLGAITGTLEDVPGLLVMIPAAIGLRGNIFSAFGNRLSTASHLGTLRFTSNPRSLLGQNVIATLVLTAGLSFAFAVMAKVVAAGLGLADTAPLLDLVVVAVVGGLLASLVVLVATVGLAVGANRYEWDLDNLVAPVVSTLGDVLTLPALWLAATVALGHGGVTDAVGVVLVVISVVGVAWSLRSGLSTLVEVVRQSLPVLLAAGALSTLAGVVIEKQLDALVALPVLLVVFPAFTSSAGALGGVLASRMATNLHTGLVEPTTVPTRQARDDLISVLLLAVPIYLFNAMGGWGLGEGLGLAGPDLPALVLAVLGAGVLAVGFVSAVAYYGTILSFRTRIDPDTVGIPVVTSSVDFVGALLFVIALTVVGIL